MTPSPSDAFASASPNVGKHGAFPPQTPSSSTYTVGRCRIVRLPVWFETVPLPVSNMAVARHVPAPTARKVVEVPGEDALHTLGWAVVQFAETSQIGRAACR